MRISRSSARSSRERPKSSTKTGPKKSVKAGKSAAVSKATGDQSLLWTVTIALFAIGAVMVYSASSATSALQAQGDPLGYLKRYLLIGAAGLILMRIASRLDLNRVRELTPVALFAAFGMLALVLVPGFGVEVNGARSWLGTEVFRFQPSEIMKLALVMYTAMLVAQDPSRVRNLKSMSNPLLYVIGLAALLVALQPDLGTDLVICVSLGMLLIAAGARLQDIGKLAAAGVLLVVFATLLEPYRMARITSFLFPGSDPTGSGYQIEQARIAIGSGGIFGVGLGESVQKVFYMPEAHTDMILAVIGEELGLFGICLVVSLYAALLVGGLRAAKNSRDAYARLLAIGITSMIICQALLNLFAVLGMAPLTGVPLPFISYGGANLVVMLVAMGLLINVASGRHTARVRVLKGGADRQRASSAQSRSEQRRLETGVAAAGAGGSQRSRGHYESRDRGRGNGRTRRPSSGRS